MTKAAPESSDSLVFECDFDEPPEKVWRALTEPQLLEAWLMTGDTPSANAASMPGEADKRSGAALDILTAEPHRLLRYRWRDRENAAGDSGAREVDSVVTFELAPDTNGGTHLRLTHGEFRIVPAAAPVTLAPVTPIAMALAGTRPGKTPILSFGAYSSLRRAA